MYLGDPRENSIREDGRILENDNREEKRYLWNGCYRDFCDLELSGNSGYTTTIFITKPLS